MREPGRANRLRCKLGTDIWNSADHPASHVQCITVQVGRTRRLMSRDGIGRPDVAACRTELCGCTDPDARVTSLLLSNGCAHGPSKSQGRSAGSDQMAVRDFDANTGETTSRRHATALFLPVPRTAKSASPIAFGLIGFSY
jgi:hypothetical protein